MAFTYLIFIVAAAISGVAAYFSLVGLGSIFAATFWGVVIMGAALEIGKIVTTKWVHANWRSPEAPWYFRGLLCFFIACLMAITSLGIYGYLSRGHLEQKAPLAGLEIQVAQLEEQVAQKRAENTQLDGRLSQISRITDKSLERSGRSGLRAAASQKSETREIQARVDANNQAINDLTAKLVPLKMKTGDVQGELGVAKFIAEAMGWEPEKAIRIIISLIMAAFDPLALSMFIMGGISLQKAREASQPTPSEDAIPEPRGMTEELAEEFKDQLDQRMQRDLEEEARAEILRELTEQEDGLRAMRDSQEKRLAELDAAHEAIQRDREEFQEEMDQVKGLLGEVGDLDEARATLKRDQDALQGAHDQLVEMEARLRDESELLTQWQADLTAQQEAINNWTPSQAPDDGKSPKELIIELLEFNPDVVNDIVQVAIGMQNAKPGL